ncbi:MAG: extracellular solute-binding protein [Lachnospiraceae bacterium]|nr:extracellular solute-binding protein [Lachnospiraceae bacterium]
MSFRSRFTAVILVLAMLCFTCYHGLVGPAEAGGDNLSDTLLGKETIHVWYTDETLTDYMNSRALAFMEENEDIRVVPTLVSAVEYLESINDATMEGETYPDVYLITDDCLEKAYLAGLATEITDPDGNVTTENYPQTALNAVTYDGKQVAYPFYYETSIFLYNRTYLDTMAQTKAEALASQAQAPDGSEAAESGDGEGAAEETVAAPTVSGADGLIPRTFDDILTLADEYDAPEGVESILKWDVSDIFYNYFFAGNYMDIGGETGDDASIIDIYNDHSVACMLMYQSLNQFFSIEADETDYELVMNEFMQGKTLFTVATTDAVAKLEQAKADGTFTWEYGISVLPDISSQLQTRGLSVTNTAVVNGFGEHKEYANAFAAYLTGEADASLYERTGKLSAKSNVTYENPKLSYAMESYARSTGLPKIIEASNFWVQLEVAYTGIWQGEDADARMKQLEEQMQKQVK